MVHRDEELGLFECSEPGVGLADVSFERCTWRGFRLWAPEGVEWGDRPRMEGVELRRCRCHRGWFVVGAVLCDVTIEHTRDRLDLLYCAYERVRVAGRHSQIEIASTPPRHRDQELVGQNTEFHAGVEWSLDLREMESKDWRIEIPDPSKVWIDPARQAFVSRESLAPARERLEAMPLEGWVGRKVGYVLRGSFDSVPQYVAVGPRKEHRAADEELIRLIHGEGLTVATYEAPV